MIRSPYPIRPKPFKDPTKDVVFNLHEVGKLVEELKTLRDQTQDEHNNAQAKREAEHQAVLAEIKNKIDLAHAHIKTIQKGDPGETIQGPQGEKGDTPAIHEIVRAVLPHIPSPEKGVPGKPGKDALPVNVGKLKNDILKEVQIPEIDHEEIVNVLKDKKLITVDHIGGLKEELASYRSQLAGKHYGTDTMVRGGGDTVAAGSNITITTVNGVKTIASTGGSGFSTLAATETPDGATTVFTFALAAAQPSYIVADNVWLKPTTAAGTVNWTWNGGTKKATLTIPPNDDIWAVV